jgi:hypothetical protein
MRVRGRSCGPIESRTAPLRLTHCAEYVRNLAVPRELQPAGGGARLSSGPARLLWTKPEAVGSLVAPRPWPGGSHSKALGRSPRWGWSGAWLPSVTGRGGHGPGTPVPGIRAGHRAAGTAGHGGHRAVRGLVAGRGAVSAGGHVGRNGLRRWHSGDRGKVVERRRRDRPAAGSGACNLRCPGYLLGACGLREGWQVDTDDGGRSRRIASARGFVLDARRRRDTRRGSWLLP